MIINILTLFPPMFDSSFSLSILKRAQEDKLVSFRFVNIRDFSTDKYKSVDDHPYGGGVGMVMMIEPIDKALQSIQAVKNTPNKKIILTSAKGKLFNQETARSFSALEELTIICGHYEGVDERVASELIDEEVRIGDYVLTGGELPAMVMSDAIVRLLPGALGDSTSPDDESHKEPGYLEYPQYSWPSTYNGWQVPEILLSGNHAQIEQWKQDNAKKTT